MKFFFSLLFSVWGLSLLAQDSLSMILKNQLLKDWQRAKMYTLQYVNAMPADKYNFRPADTVRTFAQQMLHFAKSNAGMSMIGTGFRAPGLLVFANPNFEQTHALQNKDSVLYYMITSYDMAINAIKFLDFSKLNEEVSWNLAGGKRTTTRLGWLMKAFEHQTHHRGQCTVYFRLIGLRPPGELLWDE